MADDTHNDEPRRPDPEALGNDPDALREAHSRYGAYLKKVGLPFEPEEFDDSESSQASDEAGTAGAAAETGENSPAADRPYDQSDLPDA